MTIKNKATWISPSFSTDKRRGENVFTINEVSIEEIAAHIPPPFYVYDMATIKTQYLNLEKILKPYGISIYYAMKPNAALSVVNKLHNLGAGFDVASLGELLVAQKIGANPKRMCFTGPVKNDEALIFAIEYGVDIINAENEDELKRINEFAKRKGVRQKVAIRVNIEQSTEKVALLVMSGGSSKFGIDEAQITDSFIKRIQKLSHLDLSGIHVYSANMLEAEAFLANIKNICRLAQKLNNYFTIRSIDFGGGLMVPYSQEEKSLELDKIASRLGRVFSEYPFLRKNNVALFVEPGRFLVAQSGIYVTKVDNVKISDRKKIVLVDGGIHHFLRPSIIESTHPVYNMSRIEEKTNEMMSVGGALCTPIDFLCKDVFLPKTTKRGDLIGVFIAGAYGWSEAMPYFLSMQTAAEVLVYDKKYCIIRPAEHPREFLEKQVIIE